MQFEWDPDKAASNLEKHSVSFQEAATVFADPLSYTVDDPDHSEEEQRFLTLGLSLTGKYLIVSHTDRQSNIRIISARTLTNSERKSYAEGDEDGRR
jgi:uncharacterized protein